MSGISNTSLFERIGGMSAVNAAVDIFYQKVISDPCISPFFRHINIEAQAGKLKAFLAYAFGAPLKYTGKSMREAHRHMHLTEEHFNAVATHLVSTLKELNVHQHLIDEVVAIAITTREDVLNIPQSLSDIPRRA